MTESISRAFVADIEVRAEGGGRTVAGIVVPFGRTARVSDGGPSYMEGFEFGSFAKTIRERGDRVKLLSQHNSRANPLGRATMLREDGAGLYGEFRVSQTSAGDEALELLRDGALDSFSVGFGAIKHAKREGVVWRTEVALREASLVTFPAYEDARVEAVRAWDALSDEERAAAAAMLAASIDLRSITPGQEPPTVSDTSTVEAVLADEEPSREAHSPTHLKTFNHLRLIAREKGIL